MHTVRLAEHVHMIHLARPHHDRDFITDYVVDRRRVQSGHGGAVRGRQAVEASRARSGHNVVDLRSGPPRVRRRPHGHGRVRRQEHDNHRVTFKPVLSGDLGEHVDVQRVVGGGDTAGVSGSEDPVQGLRWRHHIERITDEFKAARNGPRTWLGLGLGLGLGGAPTRWHSCAIDRDQSVHRTADHVHSNFGRGKAHVLTGEDGFPP